MISVVVSDPPWPAKDQLPGPGRGSDKHYRNSDGKLGFSDINEYLEVGRDCPARRGYVINPKNAVLFMWRVAWAVQEALDAVKAWGFKPKAEIVWQKLTKYGKHHFGMGHYVRMSHEVCIIATRGSVPVKDKGVRSTFEAPVPFGENGRPIHSAKPEAFRDIVEKLYDGPYVELFSRTKRKGWLTYGDEVGGRASGEAEGGASQEARRLLQSARAARQHQGIEGGGAPHSRLFELRAARLASRVHVDLGRSVLR